MASQKDRFRLIVIGVVVAAGIIVALVMTRSGGSRADRAAQAPGPERDTPSSSWGDGTSAPRRDGAGIRDRVTPATPEESTPVVVEGRVLDIATGEAQAGVEVEFTLPGHEGPRAEVIATSAADGRYHVEITTGRWDVRAHGAGLWAPSTRLLVAAPTAAATVAHDVLVQRAGIVRGRVLSGSGATVAAATVSVETTDAKLRDALDQTVGRSATADDDGRFELTVPPGEIRLHATDPGGTEGFAQATVAAGAEVTIDITIPVPASIAGTVRDADGDVVAGATIHVYDRVLGGGADQHLTATTDSGGAYLLDTLHPGKVTIEASRPGEGISPPTRLSVATGDRAQVDLVLGRPIAVRGRVLDKRGEPVAGAFVNGVIQGSRTKAKSLPTGSDGGFELAGIAGTYVVTATSDEHGKARVVVDVAADSDPLEVVLQEAGGIRGTITSSGQPASSVSITVERFHREGDARATSRNRTRSATLAASDGSFALPELLPGTYDLLFTAPGRAPTHVAGVVVGDGSWAEITVVLEEVPS